MSVGLASGHIFKSIYPSRLLNHRLMQQFQQLQPKQPQRPREWPWKCRRRPSKNIYKINICEYAFIRLQRQIDIRTEQMRRDLERAAIEEKQRTAKVGLIRHMIWKIVIYSSLCKSKVRWQPLLAKWRWLVRNLFSLYLYFQITLEQLELDKYRQLEMEREQNRRRMEEDLKLIQAKNLKEQEKANRRLIDQMTLLGRKLCL